MINHDLLPKIEDNPDAKPSTSCKKCLFSIKDGDTQIGCRYDDRISKFMDKDDVDVYSLTEDGQTFCIITSMCTACTQKVPEGEDDVEFIRGHLEKQLNLIIEMTEETSAKELVHTYETAINQQIPPDRIVISYNNHNSMNPQDVFMALSQPSLERKGIRFVIVQSIKGTSFDDHMLACVNKCTSPYFTTFRAGETVPYNFGETVDQLVNYQLAQFIAIKAPETSGNVCLTKLFKKAMRVNRVEDGKYDYYKALNMLTEHNDGVLQWNV